jgi:hypothetical protein
MWVDPLFIILLHSFSKAYGDSFYEYLLKVWRYHGGASSSSGGTRLLGFFLTDNGGRGRVWASVVVGVKASHRMGQRTRTNAHTSLFLRAPHADKVRW